MLTSFQFPSSNAIASYLNEHSLTSDCNFRKIGVNEAVANIFANQDKSLMGIQTEVGRLMYRVNKVLKFSEADLQVIKQNLIQALQEYAETKKAKQQKVLIST